MRIGHILAFSAHFKREKIGTTGFISTGRFNEMQLTNAVQATELLIKFEVR